MYEAATPTADIFPALFGFAFFIYMIFLLPIAGCEAIRGGPGSIREKLFMFLSFPVALPLWFLTNGILWGEILVRAIIVYQQRKSSKLSETAQAFGCPPWKFRIGQTVTCGLCYFFGAKIDVRSGAAGQPDLWLVPIK